MRLLLDESLPRQLARELSGHEVGTVQQEGWSGTKNGALLRLAARADWDAFVTADQGIEYQQNQEALPLKVVILGAPSNRIEHLRPLVPGLLAAIRRTEPWTLIRLG